MWAFSDAARVALGRSHTAVSRVEVWHSGRVSYVLQPVDGQVSADAHRPVRRNLSCRLVDPSGQLSRGDVGDLLNPYECEIAVHRGLAYGPAEHRTVELAPHGVFGLTSRAVADAPEGLVIELTGQDRAMGYQGPMASALAIPGGTPIETAVIRLLSRRNPGVVLQAMVTGYTCGPLLYAPDIDVWAEAQKLAESVGGRLFHDRTGQPAFTLAGPTSTTPVASFVEGGGLLLSVDRAEDADTIHNVVITESPDGLIRAVAEDTNPASPTYAGGRYGRRPVTIRNEHFGSVRQAQQAAQARLAYELGRSETTAITAVPDPALDVEEVVTAHRPRAGLENRGLVVATFALPLAADEPMRIGARRSVLARDGAVLPVETVTAA